jgi:hypothetical protein
MRRLALLGLALLAASCTVRPPPPPVPPTTVAFDLVACKNPVVDNYCDGPSFALFTLDRYTLTGDGDGYVYMTGRPIGTVTLTILADGYLPFTTSVNPVDLVAANARGERNFFELTREHVDPSAVPLTTLAAIRGAMWTARLNLPYGPRPGQDTNILAMTFYGLYNASDRERMLSHYHDDLGYTHAVTGPVTGNDCYHGLYPCRQGIPTQTEWDAYLDELQTWWDRGVTPVYFAKPDGWERPEHAADMNALDALYAQPRAQKLLRIVVYPGWEPSGTKYGWSNAMYVTWVQRGARVFPNALRLLHTVSDLDAPTGGNDDQTFPPGQGNRLSWQAVAPYIHGWLVQVGGYVGGSSATPTPVFLSEFTKLFTDLRHKFTGDAAGWPTSSAWGHQPLRVYYAEGASFGDFWRDWPEPTARDLGDRAMQAGADGYLDGGNVSVSER